MSSLRAQSRTTTLASSIRRAGRRHDHTSGSVATNSADALLAYVGDNGFNVAWILDTHPHADHLSAADYLKQKTGAPTGIGERVIEVQRLWKSIYNLPDT